MLEEKQRYRSEILNQISEEYNSENIFDKIKISVRKLDYCFEIKYQFLLNNQEKTTNTISIQPDKNLLKEQLTLENQIARKYNFTLETKVDFNWLR